MTTETAKFAGYQIVYGRARTGMCEYATDSTNYRNHGPLRAIVDGEEVTIPAHIAEQYRKAMKSEIEESIRLLDEWESLKQTPLSVGISSALYS